MELSEINISGYETLLLDRDGVINVLRPNDYVKKWNEFIFKKDAIPFIAKWSKQVKHILVITNQRGISKGLMTENDLLIIHENMITEIVRGGGRIDKIYYCTSLDESDPNRKPNIGMMKQAMKDFPDIQLDKCVMIGDSESDMQFARNAGIKGILITE